MSVWLFCSFSHNDNALPGDVHPHVCLRLIKLRYSQPDLQRSYRVPGGLPGMSIIAGIGLLGCLLFTGSGFLPAYQSAGGQPRFYVGLVTTGMIIFVGLPLLINK